MVQLGPLTFVCTSSGEEFSLKSEATCHAHSPRGDRKRQVCATCGKTFVDVRNMKKHERRHVPLSRRPNCPHCGAKFLTERCLLRHVDGTFQHRRCTLCGAQHRPCPELGNNLFGSCDLDTAVEKMSRGGRTSSEMLWAPPRRRVSSAVTDRSSGSRTSTTCDQPRDGLSRRKTHSSSPQVGNHKCPDCGKVLTTKSNLVRHFRLHSGERPYSCLDCGRTFVDRGNMKKHARIHSSEGDRCSPAAGDCIDLSEFRVLESFGDDAAEVPKAGSDDSAPVGSEPKTEAMSDRSGVGVRRSRSKRRRSKPHSFGCSVCSKTFPYRSSLAEHMRRHTDRRPHQCDVCGKAFKRTCDLSIHARFHDAVKRFECRDCGRRFRWKNGLDRHQRTHSGEKPFLCNWCGRAFADWGSHKQHVRRHSAPPPSSASPAERYPCQLCGKSFAWKRGLSRHNQRVHCWKSAASGLSGRP